MVNKPDSFNGSDGKILFFSSWIPSESPRLVIALIHGLGEHSGRYEQWADFFCGEHIAFVAFDLRGHGLSEGKRGNINSLKTILSDVDLFLDKAGTLFPGKPLLLYGHSLGGNLALNYYLGTGDRITSHQGSSAFKANATDKVTLKLWDGLFHELHNEPEKTKVFRFINDWIDNNFTQSDTVS